MRHIGPPYGRVICSIHVTCSYWHTNCRVAAWTLLPNTCSCVVRSCTRSEVCARKLRDLVRVTIAYAVCVFLHVSAEFCAGCIEGRQCEVNDVFPVVDGATKRRWLSQKKRHLAYVTWGVQHGVPAEFPPVPLPVCAERAIKSKWPMLRGRCLGFNTINTSGRRTCAGTGLSGHPHLLPRIGKLFVEHPAMVKLYRDQGVPAAKIVRRGAFTPLLTARLCLTSSAAEQCVACAEERDECGAAAAIRQVKDIEADANDDARALRFKAYRIAGRAETTWTRGVREPLPTCVDIAIKTAFPDANNQYTHFKLPRTGAETTLGTRV